MALLFVAIDPETDTDHCPAVFVEEETGDLLFQGRTITVPAVLAEVDGHSRIADDESAGKPRPVPASPAWFDLVREHTARGVRFRRARIVSEPVSDYIRFEYEATAGLNVAAGEEVGWLPRRQASDLRLPGNDFWLLDGRLIRFHHFSGDGRVVEDPRARIAV